MEPAVGVVGVEEEALAALNAGVDALSRLDLVELSDDRLHALTIAVQRCTARLGVARAAVVRRWDMRGVWAGDGSRSPLTAWRERRTRRRTRRGWSSLGRGIWR